MKFQLGDQYIVECIDLETAVRYRWHLNFLPQKKAFRIINEEIHVNATFRNRYLIVKIEKKNIPFPCMVEKDAEIFYDSNQSFWETCPACGDYLGEGLCRSCGGFDWDSYHDKG